MGCVKSKHSDLTGSTKSARTADSRSGKGDRASLVHSEAGPEVGPPHVDPMLLDYAQRLSEEIVSRAVQQWAELDSRYSDIPYIEWWGSVIDGFPYKRQHGGTSSAFWPAPELARIYCSLENVALRVNWGVCATP
ncbi:small membrane A-kinase anchor protein [Arapaima gigas]